MSLYSFGRRIMTALSAGYNAFTMASDPLSAFAPDGYDVYETRLKRYAICQAFYNNTVYKDMALGLQIRTANNLYRHIRSVRNPVGRLVDLYPALVYPGTLDLADPTRGAIPLDTDNDALKDAIVQLWKWSNWGVEKPVYVRTGAMLGDSFIHLVDNPNSKRVSMQVLDPSEVRAVERDDRGNIKSIVIEYQRLDEPDLSKVGIGYNGVIPTSVVQKAYTYNIYIDGDVFKTMRNGEPYAFVMNDGQPVSEWSNDYRFVPIVQARHKRSVKSDYGMCAFHNTVDKIHELNDLASHTHDQLRNAVDIVWYFAGVKNPGEVKFNENEAVREQRRDVLKALYGPADSVPHPMIADIDLSAALETIDRQLEEVVRDNPELAMHQARERNAEASGIAIKNMYSDASGIIYESQGNYDDALIRAHMMGVSMGAIRGYVGFEAFNENSYSNGELLHTIKQRPVFSDDLTHEQKLTALATVAGQPPAIARLMLKEIGYTTTEVEEVVSAMELQQEERARAEARGFANGVFGDDDEDTETDENTDDESIEEEA